MHCYVLLPAFNEFESLRRLVPEISSVLQGLPHTILILDDGSTDGSAQVLPRLAAGAALEIMTHVRNQGYGASLRTGFRWIAEHGQPEDVVISMDADTTHDPRFLDRFLKAFEAGSDVVTASYVTRGASHTGLPPIRRLMSA